MTDREQIVDELFALAIELEPAERREFFAERATGNSPRLNAGVLDEVKALVDGYERAAEQKFLEHPLMGAEPADQPALIGQQLAGYTILRLIDEGGMGEVYLARDNELDREVAIKLIKGNLKTKEILRRFYNERQILANLQHPNIAGLLEAGATADGLPYFVMEYVEGQRIDTYAEERKLSIAARLKLFRTVCSAVSYAHQNLVIHRDIKPSNILVTTDGVPKLLDFGIAKLLQSSDSQQPDATMTMFRIMTPEYASPEQVKGEPITTATDVYSLGVLLYEMLTGQRPYKLKHNTADEITKAICEQEPEKPSNTKPKLELRNAKLLRGDLDNIVLRAMRKDPQRRYASVEQFSEDIRRHLEGLPVIARKDTVWYRTSKFVGRNKLGVAAASLVLLTLVGGIAATTWEARRAQRRFNEVHKLAHAFLFDYNDAIAALPGSTKLRERLVKDSLEYLDSLSQEAGNDIPLQRELAAAYIKVGDLQGGLSTPIGNSTLSSSNLGDTAGAFDSYTKALALSERLAMLQPANGEIRRELMLSYSRMAEVNITLGRPDKAVEYYRRAIPISEALSAADPTNETLRLELDQIYFATSKALGGGSVANVGDAKGSLEYLRKSLAIDEELAAKHPSEARYQQGLAASYNALGLMLSNSGDQKGELESYRKALAIDEGLVKENETNTLYRRELAIQYGNTGSALLAVGDKAGALDNFRRAQAIYEALVAADPSDASVRRNEAVGYRNIGVALGSIGDRPGALDNFHKALQVFAALVLKDPSNADFRRQQGWTHIRMSMFLLADGDAMAAIESARQAITIDEPLVAANPKNTTAAGNLAVAYLQLGKCHTLLASKAATPSDKQMGHWREARDWDQKSLGIWRDLRDRGTLSGADQNKPDEVQSEIARCDAALARKVK